MTTAALVRGSAARGGAGADCAGAAARERRVPPSRLSRSRDIAAAARAERAANLQMLIELEASDRKAEREAHRAVRERPAAPLGPNVRVRLGLHGAKGAAKSKAPKLVVLSRAAGVAALLETARGKLQLRKLPAGAVWAEEPRTLLGSLDALPDDALVLVATKALPGDVVAAPATEPPVAAPEAAEEAPPVDAVARMRQTFGLRDAVAARTAPTDLVAEEGRLGELQQRLAAAEDPQAAAMQGERQALPAHGAREELVAALRAHRVLVVSGSTVRALRNGACCSTDRRTGVRKDDAGATIHSRRGDRERTGHWLPRAVHAASANQCCRSGAAGRL